MRPTSELRAVDLVREIRDAQAHELAQKTPAEIIAFFNRAGERAKKTRRPSKRVATASRRAATR